VLKDNYLRVFQSKTIPRRTDEEKVSNDPISWFGPSEIKVCEDPWNPTNIFVCDSIRQRFQNLGNINNFPWIVIDKFFFELLNIMILF
jgi:hypothetical protein